MRIKDWHKFQHFKDRRPPWVKLYRELLEDPDWFDLEPKYAKALVMFWLIASEDETQTGLLPDTRKLAFRLRTTEREIEQAFTKLYHWLEQVDINAISTRYQDDAPETETETETDLAQRKTSGPPKRGIALPADFYPNETGVRLAEGLNLSLAVELEKFRDWHSAKGSTMKDWQAAWRTWARNANDFKGKGNANGNARADVISRFTGSAKREQQAFDSFAERVD